MTAQTLVYLALICYVIGFLFRDELWLRGLLLIGTLFYILYYYYAADRPLWEAIVTSGILGVVNLGMIVVIILERTTFAMSQEEAQVFRHFGTLSPGQFRSLMKSGVMEVAQSPLVVCKEGQPLDVFLFIFDGGSTITKNGQPVRMAPGHFIGEVAFLTNRPASATVEINAGSRYIRWDHAGLRALLEKRTNLRNAFLALLNLDMASKIGTSMPTGNQHLPQQTPVAVGVSRPQ